MVLVGIAFAGLALGYFQGRIPAKGDVSLVSGETREVKAGEVVNYNFSFNGERYGEQYVTIIVEKEGGINEGDVPSVVLSLDGGAPTVTQEDSFIGRSDATSATKTLGLGLVVNDSITGMTGGYHSGNITIEYQTPGNYNVTAALHPEGC